MTMTRLVIVKNSLIKPTKFFFAKAVKFGQNKNIKIDSEPSCSQASKNINNFLQIKKVKKLFMASK